MMVPRKFLRLLLIAGAAALDNGVGKLPALGFNSKCFRLRVLDLRD